METKDPRTGNLQGRSENNQAKMSESATALDRPMDPLSHKVDSETTASYVRPVTGPSDFLQSKPLEVFLRYEEDVAAAYRAFYKDQIVNDKANELGRFLFGVSVTTLGFLVSVLKLSTPQLIIDGHTLIWMGLSGTLLLFSALCSLRLAVPRNQAVDPETLELVKFHRANSNELSRLSLIWFALWLGGLVSGLVLMMH